MSGWIPYRIVHCGLVIVTPCSRCRGEGWIGDDECEQCETTCEQVHDALWLATLLGNIAITAGLCRAFELGKAYGAERVVAGWNGGGWTYPFEPGCGRSAP